MLYASSSLKHFETIWQISQIYSGQNMVEVYRFLSRTQKEGETFEKFLTDLRLLECRYHDKDDMLREAT